MGSTLKADVVAHLNIFNKKRQGNVETAEKTLKVAVSACYKIKQVAREYSDVKMTEFDAFYDKLLKTKSIKHIIEINEKSKSLGCEKRKLDNNDDMKSGDEQSNKK